MKRALGLSATAVGLGVLIALPASAAVTKVYVGSFYFSTTSGGPASTPISIKAGDQLTFVAQDNGHTVELPGFNISESLSKGETFTTGALMKAGSYSLYCSPHQNKGHKTTLTVRAAAAAAPTSSPTPAPTTAGGATSGGSATTTGGSSTGSSSTSGRTTTGGSATGSTTTSGSTRGSTTSGSTTGGTATTTTAGTTTGGAAASPRPSTSSKAPAAETPVAAGRGTADAADLDVIAPEGSLEDLLGRPAATTGSWTRSVRMAVLLLLPMLGAAAWALIASRRRNNEQPPSGAA